MVDFPRLLRFARDLNRVRTFPELLEAVRAELEETTGYRHLWMYVAESAAGRFRLLAKASEHGGDETWVRGAILEVGDDAMLAEIMVADEPVVVVDARTDPRTDKRLVELFQNRTIINVRLSLGDETVGAMGLGTFGDEEPRAPTNEQLEHIQALASQVTVAVTRLRWTEEQAAAQREKEALRQRVEAAQRLESLGQLAGGVAHDFNNLLTVIINHAAFVGEGPLSDAQRRDVEALTRAADTARGVTRQLLALSRRQFLHRSRLDLDEHLAALTGMLRRLIPENIAIEQKAGGARLALLADSAQLDQVFMNLVVNAKDAMPDGGRLEIETRRVELDEGAAKRAGVAPGLYAEVSVRDSGVGMPKEVIERIFEPFYTTKKEGTGLGLAVAWGVVQQHGGAIRCASELGEGTTFTVLLPIAEQQEERPAVRAKTPAPRDTPSKILIAEDEATVRQIAERILARAGYEVELACDGEEAVACAGSKAYDLVMLDLVMPRLGGRAAFTRIRQLHPDVPILMTSGYSAEAFEELGVDVLDKPYDRAQLVSAVQRALSRGAHAGA